MLYNPLTHFTDLLMIFYLLNVFVNMYEFIFKTNGVCNVLLRFFFGKRYENDIWLKNTITEKLRMFTY